MGVLRPDLLIKCVVPVIMAGIIAVRKQPQDATPVGTWPHSVFPHNFADLRIGRQCPDLG